MIEGHKLSLVFSAFLLLVQNSSVQAFIDVFDIQPFSVGGVVRADMADCGLDLCYSPVQPEETPFGKNGRHYVTAKGEAEVQHFGQSYLEGTASAEGSVTAFGFLHPAVDFDEFPPKVNPLKFNAVIGFNASGQATGEIVRDGVRFAWSASGTYSLSAGGSMSGTTGSMLVIGLVSPHASVTLNGVNHVGAVSKIISGNLNASFRLFDGAAAYGFATHPQDNRYYDTKATSAAVLLYLTHPEATPPQLAAASSSFDFTEFPGGSAAIPLTYFPTDEEPTSGAVGHELMVPVIEGYGTTFPVFFKYTAPEDFPELNEFQGSAIGYVFKLENDDEQSFKSFSVPEAFAGGQSMWQLRFGNSVANIVAGQEFDFTQLIPIGIKEFSLLGIDPDEGLDASLPPRFLHSFRFMNDGTANVSVDGITVVPEPSSIALLLAAGVLSIQCRRRR